MPFQYFRVLGSFLLISSVLALTSCDGDTRPRMPASFAITQTGSGILGISPSPQHLFRLRFPVRIDETGGDIGGNVNFARLDIALGGRVIEVTETNATEIRDDAGTNHIDGGGALTVDLDFDFNATDFDDLDISIDITDDEGRSHSLDFNPSDDLLVRLDVLELGGEFGEYR